MYIQQSYATCIVKISFSLKHNVLNNEDIYIIYFKFQCVVHTNKLTYFQVFVVLHRFCLRPEKKNNIQSFLLIFSDITNSTHTF